MGFTQIYIFAGCLLETLQTTQPIDLSFSEMNGWFTANEKLGSIKGLKGVRALVDGEVRIVKMEF